MPRASKICSYPQCPNLQPCEHHQRKPWEGSTRRKRLPSNWARLRLHILDRDAICTVCDNALSTECDHVMANDDHSESNLQGLCSGCHTEKTQAEARARRST